MPGTEERALGRKKSNFPGLDRVVVIKENKGKDGGQLRTEGNDCLNSVVRGTLRVEIRGGKAVEGPNAKVTSSLQAKWPGNGGE